ncbi:tRNA glutamyl-Q(34) synthetase GluQRS [Porticoccaceae bacterium LTM1]|nr:tRNA glutamyl-Q(34) synthetase GluQRS [Porticoccaceae bacterium LTM1]
MSHSNYIGRFAPTPSGPLHFGSLVAALASYLDARHVGGQWLVRIDDIDPPREVAGAADTILSQLEAHHLYWDGSVFYQSNRDDAYLAALQQLQDDGLVYRCDCTRQDIKAMGGRYNGHCRQRTLPDDSSFALRVNTEMYPAIEFNDLWQGPQQWDLSVEGDFVVRRRDGLFAYQLACAVDDLFQNISHVIRGSDLLNSTPRQIFLMQLLRADEAIPEYGHIPVAINPDGQKLSKQNFASAIEADQAFHNLLIALHWLNHSPPEELEFGNCTELLDWASTHWNRQQIPTGSEIPAPAGF